MKDNLQIIALTLLIVVVILLLIPIGIWLHDKKKEPRMYVDYEQACINQGGVVVMSGSYGFRQHPTSNCWHIKEKTYIPVNHGYIN